MRAMLFPVLFIAIYLYVGSGQAYSFPTGVQRYSVRPGHSRIFKQGCITLYDKTSASDSNCGGIPDTISRIKNVMALSCVSVGLFSQLSLSRPSYAADYPVFEEVWNIVNDNFFDPTYNNNNWKELKQDYLKRLDSGANEEKLTQKMLSLLGDKYTRLLDKQFFESLWKYDAIGVGLLFQNDPGKPMYIAGPPISGSSGEKAGFQKGDVIYAINGEKSDQMTAIQLLDKMSNDDGDSVTFEYFRPSDPTGEKKTVTLARSREKATNPVTFLSKRLPDGKLAGYIRLSEFNAEAVPELKKAIIALNQEGIDELALDLRGNTGGGFQFALNVGGMFMPADTQMVTAAGRSSEDKSIFRTSFLEGVLYKKPLILITDGLSASASEVLVSGLRDNCRASVTGTRTFGKGKIQAVFGLANGEGLTMTVAQYVSPAGNVIQSKGIDPDVPMNTNNAYLNALTGSVFSKPDLEKIDFEKGAASLVKSCPVGTDTAQASTASISATSSPSS